jgi:amidase
VLADAEYAALDATGLAALVRSGEVSALEVLEAAILRIERLNPRLGAIVERLYDQARAAIADGLPDGPFCGVPFAIKDLHTLVRGSRLSHGSAFFADHVSDHDSAIVARAREAGLVVLGRTNTPEFGLSSTTEGAFLGAARNPWDEGRSAGGSSGGSGAAVASGMLPMAHATDSGGSCRIPAACCGVIGLKPTRGRVLAGLDAGEGWHDTFHAFAITRSVRDTARLLDALKNVDQPAPCYAPGPQVRYAELLAAAPPRLRVGVVRRPPSGVAVSDAVLDALDATARLLEGLGHTVEPLELGFDTAAVARGFLSMLASSVAATVAHREAETGRPAQPWQFESTVWDALQIGRTMRAGELNAAIAGVHLTAAQILRQTGRFEVVLSPTVASEALQLGALSASSGDLASFLPRVFAFAPFTSMYNVTGQPAVSLPIAQGPTGLPIGLQLAAAPGREDLLIRLAAQLEVATDWPARQAAVIGRLDALLGDGAR